VYIDDASFAFLRLSSWKMSNGGGGIFEDNHEPLAVTPFEVISSKMSPLSSI